MISMENRQMALSIARKSKHPKRTLTEGVARFHSVKKIAPNLVKYTSVPS
jgi:hypothetical protein